MDNLTEYERKRLENVQRNQQMLAALGVNSAAQTLRSSATKPKSDSKKGFRPLKRERESEPTVIRRSLRTRGISPETLKSLDVETLSPSKNSRKGFHVTAPDTPNANKQESLSFAEVFVKQSEDFSYKPHVDRLKDINDNATLANFKRAKVTMDDVEFGLKDLKLEEKNIVRISPSRIFCLHYLPYRERLILASGDKEGHLSLWDAECGEDEADGLHIYRPHSSPIAGIAIEPFSLTKVLSCSYDGFIRSMDVEKEVFEMKYNTEYGLSAICSSTSYQSVYFAEGYGDVKVLDSRVEGVSNSYTLHEKRINSIDFHPQKPYLMSTSSTDGTASIWDMRKIKKSNNIGLATVYHKRAVHSAYFSPSGNYLATTSYDDSVGLLSGLDPDNLTMIYHYNPPRRWISSFRAIWGWDDRYIFIGNMERGLDAICTTTKTTTTLNSPLLTTIPTRLATHPFHLGTLACGTGGGKVYVWQKI